MNFGELKTRVRDLGFTDDTDLTENMNLLISSLNSALQVINSDVRSQIGNYEIIQDGTLTGLNKIDMETETTVNGFVYFDAMDKATREYDNAILPFTDYEVYQDKILVFDKSIEGTFEFYYKKRVPLITSTTADTTALPIAYQVEHLLPFLTAYYCWLDDDAEIASRWYNEYDSQKTEYTNKKTQETPKARIRTDLSDVEWW
jgi:hypothetical protein